MHNSKIETLYAARGRKLELRSTAKQRDNQKEKMLETSNCLDESDDSSFVAVRMDSPARAAASPPPQSVHAVLDCSALPLDCYDEVEHLDEDRIESPQIFEQPAVKKTAASSPLNQGKPVITMIKRKQQQQQQQNGAVSKEQEKKTDEAETDVFEQPQVVMTPRNQVAGSRSIPLKTDKLPRVASLQPPSRRERMQIPAASAPPQSTRDSSTPRKTSSSLSALKPNPKQQQQQQSRSASLQPRPPAAAAAQLGGNNSNVAVIRNSVGAAAAAAAGAGSAQKGKTNSKKPGAGATSWDNGGSSSPRDGGTSSPRGALSDALRVQIEQYVKNRSIIYAINRKLKADFFAKLGMVGQAPTGV